LAKNCGLSAAMKAGIDYTCSRLVGYIDADLQTTPEDFNLLLEYTDDYELVMGIRVGRKDSAGNDAPVLVSLFLVVAGSEPVKNDAFQ